MRPTVGQWELIDRLATGGVAELFRARDLKSGDIVVIKRLRQDIDFDPEQHAGFVRELQLAMLCDHKNLIRGFAKGSEAGNDYGVLELIDGHDLGRSLARSKERKRPLPPTLAVHVVAEVLDGLDHAWRLKDAGGRQLGLVHRDIAPKNVLIGYDGRVCLGDFGSSLATTMERADAVVGSLGYLSPEQARNDRLDARSDLYACGLLLFELLIGVPAFEYAAAPPSAKRDQMLLRQHQRGEVRAVPRGVADDLRLVLEIATAPDADDRYQTARDMRRGLLQSDHAPPADASRLLSAWVTTVFDEEYAASRMGPLTQLHGVRRP